MRHSQLLAAAVVVFATAGSGGWGITTINPQAGSVHAHDTTSKPDPNPKVDDGQQSDKHKHKSLKIPAGQPAPSVDLVVHPDALKGWNLEVKVANFRFAPERVNTTSDFREGHAHLNINGKKVTRLYGPWYYLGSLSPGRHQVSVILNANAHEELLHNGKRIEDTAVIEVPRNP